MLRYPRSRFPTVINASINIFFNHSRGREEREIGEEKDRKKRRVNMSLIFPDFYLLLCTFPRSCSFARAAGLSAGRVPSTAGPTALVSCAFFSSLLLHRTAELFMTTLFTRLSKKEPRRRCRDDCRHQISFSFVRSQEECFFLIQPLVVSLSSVLLGRSESLIA